MRYSKQESAKRNPKPECATRGCKVKVSKGRKYCGLHTRGTSSKNFPGRLKKPVEFKKAKFAFQLYVKLRDCDDNGTCQCVSCGKRMSWTKIQGGHYFAAKNRSTCFDDVNVHPQCALCNMNMGDPNVFLPYTDFMRNILGQDGLESLRVKSLMRSNYSAHDFQRIGYESLLKAEKLHQEKFGSPLEHRLLTSGYKKWKEKNKKI